MNTLLQTKLYIPTTRTGNVPRTRLLNKLNDGLDGKLTLVSAPAGFGKTTVIADWLSQLDRPAAWVSLAEEDSNPHQFFTYVAAAIRPFFDSQNNLTALLESPEPPPAKTLATALLNDLVTLSTPMLLILDDYHAIESIEIDAALTFLLDHLPPQLHLVMTTREDPPFPLSRYRVRGQLTELRVAELRFTADETAVFLNQMMGLTLTAENIATLATRTEGWIAGLQLAALSMQGREDTAVFIQAFTGSHHFILDYLIEEVLQGQPERVRKFLLQTSILEQLSSPLCNSVTGQEDGSEMLTALEQGNLFVIRLDDQRRWYRYHHLFAEMLRTHLGQEQPDLVPILHQRASDWYAENGRSADAIRHALAAKDFERAARHIELAWRAMDITFQSEPWRRWADALPDSLVRMRPVLNVGYAWAQLNVGELDACEVRLQEAERWLNISDAKRDELGIVVVDEVEFQQLPATIASARAYAAQAVGDMVGTVKYARQAFDLLPEDDHLSRAIPASLLGITYWTSGELEAAYEILSYAFNSFQKSDNIIAAISGTFVLADMKIAQGRLHDAIQTYEQALRLVSAQGDLNLRGTANLFLGLSELYRERAEWEAAAEYLQKSNALKKQAAEPVFHYRKRVALAHIKTSQGAFDEALDLLHEAAPWLAQIHLPEIRPLAAIKARVRLKQGRLDDAMAWVQQRALSVDDELSYLQEFEHMTLARILIANYQNGRGDALIPEAMGLLQRLLQAAEAGQRVGSVLEILILQVLAHEAQGDISSARAPLERALPLAEPEGHVRLFINEGTPMAHLLAAVAADGFMPDYVGRLLAAFEAEGQKRVDKASLAQPLVDPLSKRELEILRLIADGLKNKEIAEQLVISLNTVLYHIKNIYSKLGVNKRTLAITKAKELNLI